MKVAYSETTIRLNPEQPYWIEEFSRLDLIIQEGVVYRWCSWFQYLPLSSIVYADQFGVLDSNCYHLFSSVEKESKQLNFLHQDCLDVIAMTITKIIQFIDSDDQQYNFEINISTFEYENQWYYFDFILFPNENQFQIIIIKNQQIIKDEILNVVPFSNVKLLQKIGGSLLVEQSRLRNIERGMKFASFPGKIIPINNDNDVKDFANYAIEFIGSNIICICESNNQNNNIGDHDFLELDLIIYNSQYPNCNSFLLSGWFKIKDIIQSDIKMTYQFIKVSSNLQSSQLSNENLSPFQLFYYIQENSKKLIITSYSYQFPSVSLDFINNPFLITREFNINHNIQLWHLIYVKLIENDFYINIKFYDKKQVYEYSIQLMVYQFHQIYYKLILGNYQQSTNNYINIIGRNLYLFNCDTNFLQQNCHYSCQECDGPTNEDCLSCSLDSKRIYLPEYKQCICPYFTIEDYDCKSYSDLNLQLISHIEQNLECKYGQFEIDGLCYDCPGIRNQEFITCLECILNPKEWIQNPTCQTNLQLNKDGSTSKVQKNSWQQQQQYYIFNGINLELCAECVKSNLLDQNNINEDNNVKLQQFKQFCFTQVYSNQCYKCELPNCLICSIQLTGAVCLICDWMSDLINGLCNVIKFGIKDQNNCISPYYITSNQYCKICPINKCLHCFEYVSDDLTKCTLYKDFQIFNGDDNLKVGCALCENGYIFDFQLGMCLQQSSKIETCLRSYINQKGTEICTLSSKEDFSVAREIINCEKLISNCLQCFITVQSILRCIICKEGYTSTTTEANGRCYINKLQYAKISIEGDYYLKDAWMQRIQSFMGSFLPNSYFYPTSNSYFIGEIAISCLDGYQLVEYRRCIKYCNSDCKQCKLNISPPYFYCNQCLLDYYKKPQRVEKNGQCLKCSPLCEFCESRTLDEISLIQPNFIVNEKNEQYTKKCIQHIFDPNVTIQAQQLIPLFCLNEKCSNALLYQFYCYLDSSAIDSILTTSNINYLNQIGVQTIIIQLQYTQSYEYCDGAIQINAIQLKQNIFSLRTTNLTIFGNEVQFKVAISDFSIDNFDIVQMFNFTINLQNLPLNFLGNTKLKLKMKNIKILGNEQNQTNKLLNSNQFGSIILVNITIINIVFTESSFFKIESLQIEEQVQINYLLIFNCTFINTDLFLITNSQLSIQIDNLKIENCTLFNSSILKMKQNQIVTNITQISRILVINCKLDHSYIINYYDQFKLELFNLQIEQNIFYYSSFLSFNYNMSLIDFNVQNNILDNSILIKANDINTTNFVIFSIDKFKVVNIKLINSNLIYFISQLSNMIIQFSNFILENIETLETNNQQQYLLKITHSFNCSIKQVQILNSKNFPIFSFFENNEILIENLIFQQNQQKNQITNCQQKYQFNNQLLFIQGFSYIKLNQLKIFNYQNFNQAFIEIISYFQHLESINEKIEISDTLIENNIIQKVYQKNMLSIISIYSKNKQFILFENLQFKHNFFHQYQDDPNENFASLVYIDSPQAQIIINNLFCKENAITNSSTSFIVIISQSILFINNTISYHNVINQKLWSQFYEFELGIQYDQDQINQIIQQIYPIYVQGGVAKIISEQFICQNSIYQHILALTSAIFDIKLKVKDLYNLLTFQLNQSILYINKEQIILVVSNANFLNVVNGMSTVIFSISPSQRKAKILLLDIKVINCFSFLNQIMKVQFSLNKNKKQFKLKMLNITLIFEKSAWIRYFQQFGQFTEITEINGDDGVFNIIGGQVMIEQFIIQGIILSQIFQIVNSNQILMKNVQISDISAFYQLPLIFINQQLNSIVILQNIMIQRFSIYQMNYIEENIENTENIQQYVIVECQLKKLILIDNYSSQNFIKQNIQLLQQQSTKIGYPLIQFISQNYQVRFIINQVKLIQNNCLSCSKGILFFDLNIFNYVEINEFLCIYNSIKENGCIYFKGNSQNYNKKVTVHNSDFILNNGSQGGAIMAENITLFINNCKIIGNTVSQLGGGIYANINKSEIKINKSILILNKAKVGGGIYFAKQNNLNEENFSQTYLLFNHGETYANNLVETPTHLSLSINQMDMMSEQLDINSNVILISKIKPYNIIEQGNLLKAKQIKIPSNQKINSYKIYVPQLQIYVNYIDIMLISFKNRFNEKLEDLNYSYCQVKTAIVYENNRSVSQEKILQDLQLDLKNKAFDLSSLSFSFDPYNQNQSLLQIGLNCYFDQSDQKLQYLIYAKTLKCQLGEFYIDKGCQNCQSNQGFYSVTYNTTKCSIFDKQKFESISSNQIKLLQGYWRPNYLSDYTEYCFKNPTFCIGGWDVGHNLCSLGHIGALCEECDIFDQRGKGQFYKDLQEFQCQECNKIWKSMLSFIFTSIWSFLSILITLRSIDKSNKLFSSLKIGQKYSKIIFKLNQDHESILIKMLLNYLWIFSVIFNFNISFSISFNFIEQTSNTLFVMINNLDCYLSQIQNIELIYLRLIFMLILIIIQLLIIWAGFTIQAKFKKQLLNRSIISNTLLYLYVSNYAALIKQFCSIISKRQISQISYIQGDVSLLFGTPNHISWIICFAIPGLGIFGLFIPFSLFFIMYINRAQLDQIKLRRHICYLFNEYNSESYYWELIKLSKKTIIIIILTYFEGNIFFKASLLGLCLLVYQMAAVKQQPYIISSLNFLDVQTGQICSITIFLAGANYVCEQENYSNLSLPLQICIVLLCVRLCYSFIINIFRVYLKKYKVLCVEVMYKICRFLKADCFLTVYLNNQLKKLNQREQRLRNNFIKMRCHLMSMSKAQIGHQKQIISLINSQSTIRYRQTIVDVEMNKLIST
ncbi:unnamed protein product [Paramecium primaurelia]|uniref:Transmembrane protein n=1 Tax=Paramecium primaurelia TaxID=5886 RepID=A0A8S1NSS2_PARPR|nr:unnamed protein product [Paramecium primaurelia]